MDGKPNLPPGVSRAQQLLMKKVEKDQAERVTKLNTLRTRNIRTGLLIAGSVLGIYAYTMFAVKQESILDELEELGRHQEKQKS